MVALLPFLDEKSRWEDCAVMSLACAFREKFPLCEPSIVREPVRLDTSIADVSSSVTIPAQSEEMGSKSATDVRAILPASGNETGVTYSRMAKIAVQY